MSHLNCKSCGYIIVRIEFWKIAMYLAQQRGFCGTGCESVYDKLKEIEAALGKAA